MLLLLRWEPLVHAQPGRKAKVAVNRVVQHVCCYSIQVNTLTQDTLIKPALCSNHCPRPWGCMGGGHRPDPWIRSSQYNGETGSKWAKEVSGGSVGIEKTAVKEALSVCWPWIKGDCERSLGRQGCLSWDWPWEDGGDASVWIKLWARAVVGGGESSKFWDRKES